MYGLYVPLCVYCTVPGVAALWFPVNTVPSFFCGIGSRFCPPVVYLWCFFAVLFCRFYFVVPFLCGIFSIPTFLCGFHDFAVLLAPFLVCVCVFYGLLCIWCRLYGTAFTVLSAFDAVFSVRFSRFAVHFVLPVLLRRFFLRLANPGMGPGHPLTTTTLVVATFSSFFSRDKTRGDAQAYFGVLDVTRLPTVVSAQYVHVYGWIVYSPAFIAPVVLVLVNLEYLTFCR